MKLIEKRKAMALRKKGASLDLIARDLRVSKASVSSWVREVRLTKKQIEKLRKNSHSRIAIEKRRISRIKKEEARRDIIQTGAQKSIRAVTNSNLFFIGLALYWGEGTKKKRGVVEFTNSDPEMIRIMMVFLENCCKVKREKFRGHVFLHEHLSVVKAEKYWSKISGIKRSQFHKTSVQHNRKRVHKDSLPYGTFAIIVCDTELKLKINGWTKGMCNKLLQ